MLKKLMAILRGAAASGDYCREYERHFRCAVDLSASMGFRERWYGFNTGVEYDYDILLDKVSQLAGIDGYSGSAGQSLKWCHYLQPYVEMIFDCKVWTTVGQLWVGDKYIYNPSVDDFKKWVSQGVRTEDLNNRCGIDLHAWLTLENGCLIDISFFSTLAGAFPDNYGGRLNDVVFGRPENIIAHHQYIPVIVGQQIIESINSRSCIPLLAGDEKDLYQSGGAFIQPKK